MSMDMTDRTVYDFGKELFQRMRGLNKFVLTHDTADAWENLEACLLNTGAMLHMYAVAHTKGEQQKSRLNREIVSVDTICQRAAAAYPNYFKATTSGCYAWILSALQAHRSKANMDAFEEFVRDCYKHGIDGFRTQETGTIIKS